MRKNNRLGLAFTMLLAFALAACDVAQDDLLESQGATQGTLRVNVLLNTAASPQVLSELGKYGQVRDVLSAIDSVLMNVKAEQLNTIRALPFVDVASPDAERLAAPVDTVAVEDFAEGVSTWDNDAINVTEFGTTKRQVAFDGAGVYVAVIDTGLVDAWRSYFPEERIAEEFAKSFGGGGGERGDVSEQPNKWEHDQNSHGTHVTSTILGYNLNGVAVSGVAPKTTVIPIKVLNQNGSGWSSVVAQGITYIGDLKKSGALGGAPVVINMSLGGSVLDAVEKAAVDYAIEQGVIIVASAGNSGTAGMGYPGAYAPVVSVAAAGWIGQWTAPCTSSSGAALAWWRCNTPDPTRVSDYFIADFSSRELAGQDLDVTAPGHNIVGPYKVNSGNRLSYYYLSGTSMSSPHVAGIAALMVDKSGGLSQTQVETILETAALPMPAGCRTVLREGEVCWKADATGAGFITADAALAVIP